MSEASVEHRLEALDRALGVAFRDPELREASLTHRSFAFEHDLTVTNERLEFLGDSVLGLVVTDLAYRMYPAMPEGELAKLRAAIVNMTALADDRRRDARDGRRALEEGSRATSCSRGPRAHLGATRRSTGEGER